MNPLIIIGDTFILVGRQWRLILRANWWVLLAFLGALLGTSWLSLRLLEIVPRWMSVEFVQTMETAIALSPEFFTLAATGVIAHRTSARLGGFGFGTRDDRPGPFLRRWISISGLVFLCLVGIEIGHTRYLEFQAGQSEYEFQGMLFMGRYYASIAVLIVGLFFLVALQSRVNSVAGGKNSGSGGNWRAYLAILVAGLILYMSVTSTLSQLFLFLPPFGFFWAALDRLQPPYFFLTETARVGAQVFALIIYAGFIVVAGEVVRWARGSA